jgi:DNA integrity scanning protein DisA with diadenylate cyclase activity
VDFLASIDEIKDLPGSPDLVLVTKDPSLKVPDYECIRGIIAVPAFSFARMDQIKLATVVGLARGVLEMGQKIVCLSGVAGSGSLDTLVVMEVGAEFEIFGGHAGEFLSSDVHPEVLIKAMGTAMELSLEGREGKPLGTCFVIGDHHKVLSYTRQMTINPFRGYKEEERSLLSPQLEETVKEFAAIDGAFIVRGDGVIETAGAYLQPPGGEKPLEPGLGARHAAAASITEATEALAMAVSESTGAVRLYRGGSVVMSVERPRGPA